MRLELNTNLTHLLMLTIGLLCLLGAICIPTYLYTQRVTTALNNGYEETVLPGSCTVLWTKVRK